LVKSGSSKTFHVSDFGAILSFVLADCKYLRTLP
jgi:hypothetical protein